MDYHEAHPKRRGEDLFAWIILVVGVVLFWQAYEIAGFSGLSSPGAFPMAAAAVMILASVIVVVGNARKGGARSDERILPVTIALFTGLVIAYALTLAPLGFTLSSLLFLTLGMKLLYRRGWLACMGLAIVSIIVVYVLFRIVFQVVLPEGIVPEGELLSAIQNLFAPAEENAQ
jgi:putative tricarboxylic transport membrane protein